jgi:hypothetical protein
MDSEEMRMEVFRRTGKSIDPDDPFFVAVEMLSLVTGNMEQRHASMLTELRKENVKLGETGQKVGQLIGALNDAGRRVANDNPSDDDTFSKMLRNAAATRSDVITWLAAANKKLDSFLLMQFAASCVGGIVGGIVILMVQHSLK